MEELDFFSFLPISFCYMGGNVWEAFLTVPFFLPGVDFPNVIFGESGEDKALTFVWASFAHSSAFSKIGRSRAFRAVYRAVL